MILFANTKYRSHPLDLYRIATIINQNDNLLQLTSHTQFKSYVSHLIRHYPDNSFSPFQQNQIDMMQSKFEIVPSSLQNLSNKSNVPECKVFSRPEHIINEITSRIGMIESEATSFMSISAGTSIQSNKSIYNELKVAEQCKHMIKLIPHLTAPETYKLAVSLNTLNYNDYSLTWSLFRQITKFAVNSLELISKNSDNNHLISYTPVDACILYASLTKLGIDDSMSALIRLIIKIDILEDNYTVTGIKHEIEQVKIVLLFLKTISQHRNNKSSIPPLLSLIASKWATIRCIIFQYNSSNKEKVANATNIMHPIHVLQVLFQVLDKYNIYTESITKPLREEFIKNMDTLSDVHFIDSIITLSKFNCITSECLINIAPKIHGLVPSISPVQVNKLVLWLSTQIVDSHNLRHKDTITALMDSILTRIVELIPICTPDIMTTLLENIAEYPNVKPNVSTVALKIINERAEYMTSAQMLSCIYSLTLLHCVDHVSYESIVCNYIKIKGGTMKASYIHSLLVIINNSFKQVQVCTRAQRIIELLLQSHISRFTNEDIARFNTTLSSMNIANIELFKRKVLSRTNIYQSNLNTNKTGKINCKHNFDDLLN